MKILKMMGVVSQRVGDGTYLSGDASSVLAEPIQDVLMSDARGRPCIETTTTLDLQRALAMTAGNIYNIAGDGIVTAAARSAFGAP